MIKFIRLNQLNFSHIYIYIYIYIYRHPIQTVLLYHNTSVWLVTLDTRNWNRNAAIKTLIHRALMICFDSTLDAEIKYTSLTLCNNGFPLNVQTIITNSITEFNKIKQASVQKCQVCIHFPWLGWIRKRLANQTVQKCYFSANVRVVFKTKPNLTSIREDILSSKSNNSLIYLFRYNCDFRYMGRTNQRLDARIKHVPTKIRNYIGDWLS